MQASLNDKAALDAAAIEALGRGNFARAREIFEQVAASGRADASTHVGIAYACRGLGDPAGAMQAIDRALGIDQRNLQALIVKADFLHEAGDARAASAFYRAAVNMAPPAERLPAALAAEVRRANDMVNRYAGQFEAHLGRWLSERRLAPGSSARFSESLELLFGRKEIYFQRPRYYYFPGLPQVQFYDRSHFPWLPAIEAATAEIREELMSVLQDEAAFKPYVESSTERPRKDQAGMLDNPAWSAFYLWKNGERVEANAARCPRTMRALELVPLTRVQNRSPSVLFSLLRPGAHIPPHNGMVNTRLICHLPLVVPEGCEFRVGNEVRTWQEGRAWVFDDTIEHEAWNRSDATRVILLFEVWKPELTVEERLLVNAMFEAIDAHAGEKPAWEI
ncbi:MAG TPA: aspartyl/asparaginyl beta-hydroxylase domain-containing protein [Usitatibacter sp.]|nr:aspartyl/asparaginyl beta-hydroxylase domain-containing protein [Usitatibacter sp.]